MTRRTININEPVGLKLTDAGKAHYARFWYRAIDNTSLTQRYVDEYIASKTTPDKDGFVWWQLWHVMEVFGTTMGIGMSPPYFERNELVFKDL